MIEEQQQSPILKHIRDLEKDIPEIKTVQDVKTLANLEQHILERENTYKSCCILVDKRALLFFSQLSISITTLIVCVYQLITHYDNCDNNQLYSNILMMILGVWVPQPNMKK
jgi:hypothetical protein